MIDNKRSRRKHCQTVPRNQHVEVSCSQLFACWNVAWWTTPSVKTGRLILTHKKTKIRRLATSYLWYSLVINQPTGLRNSCCCCCTPASHEKGPAAPIICCWDNMRRRRMIEWSWWQFICVGHTAWAPEGRERHSQVVRRDLAIPSSTVPCRVNNAINLSNWLHWFTFKVQELGWYCQLQTNYRSLNFPTAVAV